MSCRRCRQMARLRGHPGSPTELERECTGADIIPRTFHLGLFPIPARVAERGCETVVYLMRQQASVFARGRAEELLYGGNACCHRIRAGASPTLREASCGGFHKSRGILARKQICLAHIAVVEGAIPACVGESDSHRSKG